MIISASYKTDIPTFYGEWFMNRLKAGYCKMVNPYSQHIYRTPYRMLCNSGLQKSLEARIGVTLTHSCFTPLHNFRYGIHLQSRFDSRKRGWFCVLDQEY